MCRYVGVHESWQTGSSLSWGAFLDTKVCLRVRGVPLGMRRIHPQCHDSSASDPSVAAELLLRQVPDEEEDEEEEDRKKKDDDDDDDETYDGYSESDKT